MSTEIGLRKGDAEGGVGGEVELGVALSPVFDNSNVYGRSSAGTMDVGHLEIWYTRQRERSKLQRVAVKVGGFWCRWGFVYTGMQGLVGCGLESADPRQRLVKAELSVAMTMLTGSVLGIGYPL